MHGYIRRNAEEDVKKSLKRSPVVAILGPRQSGKSTLAKELLKNYSSVYLDLQNRADLNKLSEPELFFEEHREELICLDEIQLIPEFFSVLRSEIDYHRRPGRFLILGSASRDLIRQSSESLAGRISYTVLSPFLYREVSDVVTYKELWLRGGFPESLLAENDEDSIRWRQDFIRTFLERDIPALGFSIPIPVMERLWRLLAHYHGRVLNYSKLSEAADISVKTLKKYIAVLEQTFMIRILPPCESNMKKRLVKSPKVFIRDTGLLHSLLDIDTFDDLLAHPVIGASWEGFALENIVEKYPRWRPSFLRTSNGAEVDLILEKGMEKVLFEFKASKAPKPSRGFFEIAENVNAVGAFVIAPVDEDYEYKKGIRITNLNNDHLLA